MPLHELTRRQLMRVAFVAFCILPTLLIVAWGFSRRLPGNVRTEQQALSTLLGLPVRLTDVSYPRPGAILYHGLELHDVETGALVLRCATVEAADNGTYRVVRAGPIEVEATFARELWQLLERQLRQPPASATTVRLLAGQVTWRNAQASQTFTDVAGYMRPATNGNEAELNFRLAGEQMPEPTTLRVARRLDGGQATSRYSLRTGSTPLPVTVLAPLVDASPWLGSRCRFHGWLWLDEASEGWHGELAGRLSEVNLDSLVTQHFPHALSGLADLQIERAHWENSRLMEAAGTLQAGPGVVSRSLVQSAAAALQLGGEHAAAINSSMVTFDRLAFDFAIDPSGLSFVGRCPSESLGAMLTARLDQGLPASLWTSPKQPQSTAALLRALVPVSQLQAPVTRESDLLMRHLPVPQIVPPVGTKPTEPTARLRLGGVK